MLQEFLSIPMAANRIRSMQNLLQRKQTLDKQQKDRRVSMSKTAAPAATNTNLHLLCTLMGALRITPN